MSRDRATDALFTLFNADAGRRYLADRRDVDVIVSFFECVPCDGKVSLSVSRDGGFPLVSAKLAHTQRRRKTTAVLMGCEDVKVVIARPDPSHPDAAIGMSRCGASPGP